MVRFVEAFGLWRRKRWAAWFGVLSGGIYVPMELYEMAHGYSWVKLDGTGGQCGDRGVSGLHALRTRKTPPGPVQDHRGSRIGMTRDHEKGAFGIPVLLSVGLGTFMSASTRAWSTPCFP